ncbi:IEC3 subunit of the Ino80 complex, chromatin re-modelling-domain-containing protein [Podospora fimiseda]|uniref:IEC3 subunit of the Ino80 complex, chromatin re-modelling-domain-containing protein n=1 Tax=Podospora fimiseda TaxID=252190 RepID=A0AAN7BTY3_9PEZI|nr:IEC3 subunit of the Ino80 complex, chromatin re-modelling-domain-containing protein [Podospora fimiseda]
MEVESRRRIADVQVKDEDETNSNDTDMKSTSNNNNNKPSYRSWKKKYRKMRIVFDDKMQENESLHKLEQKALATAKRLAIQKDRLVDLLLDVNNSSQIPPEKRFDLSMEPTFSPEELALLGRDLLPQSPPPKDPNPPSKSYRNLLQAVPHQTFASSPDKFPTLMADLKIGRDSPADPQQGSRRPPAFLTADDLDNYLWELDQRLKFPADELPTMAPLAHPDGNNTQKDSSRDFALRNPVSVYNWLRKNAPKTFLQDGEQHQAAEKEDEGGISTPVPMGPARRTVNKGESKASSSRGGSGTGRGGRKPAVRLVRGGGDEDDEDTAYEGGGGIATPTVKGGGAAAKRKRGVTADDDSGYRPKGGNNRPAKKPKRKSEGGDATPTATKKSGGAAARKSGGGGDVTMRDD